jgi:hypothetical protein
MVTQAFAQTECYFDNKFADGTYGFILQDHNVVLIQNHGRFLTLDRKGSEIWSNNHMTGELKLFPPRGIMIFGSEISSFNCSIWHTGGRGFISLQN